MPLIVPSSYNPPTLLNNCHLQVLMAYSFRIQPDPNYKRERIFTPDHDFLDLDWINAGSSKLVIISHGITGSSMAPYVQGMAHVFSGHGFSVLSWNNRGRSGESNLKPYFYHCGVTHDLQTVISHAIKRGFKQIVLVGFSMGGSITLKYLGEKNADIEPQIQGAITFSVPCDIASCAKIVDHKNNRFYFRVMMRTLEKMLKDKDEIMPGIMHQKLKDGAKSFKEFDEHHTAPMFGFANAEAYWQEASCKPYLADIKIKSLLVNATDDPLLSDLCYPCDIAENSEYFYFENPKHGSHVSFVSFEKEDEYWSESRALEFALNL